MGNYLPYVSWAVFILVSIKGAFNLLFTEWVMSKKFEGEKVRKVSDLMESVLEEYKYKPFRRKSFLSGLAYIDGEVEKIFFLSLSVLSCVWGLILQDNIPLPIFRVSVSIFLFNFPMYLLWKHDKKIMFS